MRPSAGTHVEQLAGAPHTESIGSQEHRIQIDRLLQELEKRVVPVDPEAVEHQSASSHGQSTNDAKENAEGQQARTRQCEQVQIREHAEQFDAASVGGGEREEEDGNDDEEEDECDGDEEDGDSERDEHRGPDESGSASAATDRGVGGAGKGDPVT